MRGVVVGRKSPSAIQTSKQSNQEGVHMAACRQHWHKWNLCSYKRSSGLPFGKKRIPEMLSVIQPRSAAVLSSLQNTTAQGIRARYKTIALIFSVV